MAIKISLNERDNYLIRPRSLCMWASKVLKAKSFKLKIGMFLFFRVTQDIATADTAKEDDVKQLNVRSLNRTCWLTCK